MLVPTYNRPPGDAEALGDQTLAIAMDRELRAKLGEPNRHRIEMEFSPRRMCEETVAVIVERFRATRWYQRDGGRLGEGVGLCRRMDGRPPLA